MVTFLIRLIAFAGNYIYIIKYDMIINMFFIYTRR